MEVALVGGVIDVVGPARLLREGLEFLVLSVDVESPEVEGFVKLLVAGDVGLVLPDQHHEAVPMLRRGDGRDGGRLDGQEAGDGDQKDQANSHHA